MVSDGRRRSEEVDSVYAPVNQPTPSREGGLELNRTTTLPNQRNQVPVFRKSEGQSSLKIKRGFRSVGTPKVCGVSFECHPLWLWTLRPSDWSEVWMTAESLDRLSTTHALTLERFRHLVKTYHDGTDNDLAVEASDVWWISGSKAFVEVESDRIGGCPNVVCLTKSPRRTPSPVTEGEKWYSISHQSVGGVTNARGIFRLRGFALLTMIPDLPRTIAHILKYGLRGTPCNKADLGLHYNVSDTLSVRGLGRPVVFESCFSATGWCKRPLDPVELSLAYELPEFVVWSADFGDNILPLQIGRAVMEEVIHQIGGNDTGPSKASKRLKVSQAAEFASVDHHWMPEMGKWMPGSWTDTAIADRAVKADDASINFSPWNRRITLVLPRISSRFITIMENLCHARWCRTVARSFTSYLFARHGPDWASQLLLQRRALSLAGRECVKRQRVELDPLDRGVGRTWVGRSATSSDLALDVKKGTRVLSQIMKSSWWEWKNGSSLVFWRWNGREQQLSARDGMAIFVAESLPRDTKGSKPPRIPVTDLKCVATKVDAMLQRGYLEEGSVLSRVHYFAVPKGEDDIRVVFDGTSSGLNEALWAPNFYLPTSRAASLLLTFTSWMADVDFGEMFHNFFISEKMRKYAGIDISPLTAHLDTKFTVSKGGVPKVRWNRLFMGMRPSPYNAVRFYYWGEDVVRGNPADLKNPMRFDRVILNLPCTESYDPGSPKVMKWNDSAFKDRGAVAGDVVTFVDDGRLTGFSKENCHAVHRRFASRVQYLGMQDAPRKFRPPSQDKAGAWTGTIFKVTKDQITKTVAQEKWGRGRAMIKDLLSQCKSAPDRRPQLKRKELERSAGFLIHLAMTFDDITPFMKGIYLTLNAWRPQRDSEGWRLSDKKWKRVLFDRHDRGLLSDEELEDNLMREDAAPETVKGVIRLESDLESLDAILSPEVVPKIGIRSRLVVSVVYGFGDASGTGLGATFTCGSGFNFRIGVWGTIEKDESSNWKEFSNVVTALEDEAKEGNLEGAEVFMFTDNSTVESCAVRGTSSSPKLLSLVVKLRAMTTMYGVKLHIFHVAGTRMIAQGTDGVSRGYLALGVMAGEAMTAFIPIHLSAVDRSPGLVDWVKGWCGSNAMLLTPMGWFGEGHDISGWTIDDESGFDRPVLSEGRTYVWAPPPFAADVALAELRKARIKRQSSCHVVVCPRLCSPLWIKQLYKASDVVIEIPSGTPGWPNGMHEPLLIGLLFPFLRHAPWQLRGTPKMHAMGRELRGLFKEEVLDPRDLLCKFWGQCVGLGKMREDVVRKMLYLRSHS